MKNTFSRLTCDCGFTCLDPQDLNRKYSTCPVCGGTKLKYKHDIHLLNCKCTACGILFQINAERANEEPTVCPVPACQSSAVILLPENQQVDFSAITTEDFELRVAESKVDFQNSMG